MKKWLLVLVVGALFAFTHAARAGGPHTSVVLIVTNNHSLQLGRPQLRYADDDGARYYDLFVSFTDPSNVALLAELDQDSRKLFPHVVDHARRPTVAELKQAVARLKHRAQVERARGREVDFYFVYAGHGDVDRGQGFVELADGRFTGEELEQLLKTFPAKRKHVIVDACNSFFLVNARRPGGKRFATPRDAAARLSTELADVGVFLSTTSEADVYEWSELQSGIFSHAVRSGLSGAADADRDGRVSYRELRAFVGVAASQVTNPRYRPKVFARGPGGKLETALVDLGQARGTMVEVPGDRSRRLTVRDVNDIPRVDLHNEQGFPVRLLVGESWLDGAEIVERSEGAAPGTEHRFALVAPATDEARADAEPPGPIPETLSPPATLELAQLTSVQRRGGPRGPDRLFTMLFARPFGPRGLAQYEADLAKEPEPVFGVTDEQIERLDLVLDQIAGMQGSARRFSGGTFVGFGLGIGAVGVGVATSDAPREDRVTGGIVLGSVGLGLTAAGVSTLAIPSYSERLRQTYREGLTGAATPAQRELVYAATVEGFLLQAKKQRRVRHFMRGVGAATVLLGAGFAIGTQLDPENTAEEKQLFGIYGAFMGSMGVLEVGVSFLPTPIERMVTVWQDDPSHARDPKPMAIQLRPLPVRSGLGLGLQGQF